MRQRAFHLQIRRPVAALGPYHSLFVLAIVHEINLTVWNLSLLPLPPLPPLEVSHDSDGIFNVLMRLKSNRMKKTNVWQKKKITYKRFLVTLRRIRLTIPPLSTCSLVSLSLSLSLFDKKWAKPTAGIILQSLHTLPSLQVSLYPRKNKYNNKLQACGTFPLNDNWEPPQLHKLLKTTGGVATRGGHIHLYSFLCERDMQNVNDEFV